MPRACYAAFDVLRCRAPARYVDAFERFNTRLLLRHYALLFLLRYC